MQRMKLTVRNGLTDINKSYFHIASVCKDLSSKWIGTKQINDYRNDNMLREHTCKDETWDQYSPVYHY